MPGQCLLCGDRCPAGDGLDLCPACQRDLPRNRRACHGCAEPLGGAASHCGHCRHQPPPNHHALAPFLYAAPLDSLILRLKTPAGLTCGRTLGRLLAQRIAAAGVELPTLLVPVPLHPARLRERGFNQAAVLARQLSVLLDVPWDAGVLRKTRRTEDQRHLDRRARRRNLRGSFVSRALEKGCHVALVDDVITTGATSQEAARALLHAGAGRVDVWALARTP